MKYFDNPVKNLAFTFYRLVAPLVPLDKLGRGLMAYPGYVKDLFLYQRADSSFMRFQDLYPMLHEKTSTTSVDAHYFYQIIWLYKHILQVQPYKHIDVGSQYELSGLLSLITKSFFVDIRPIRTQLPNLKVIEGSILSLPFKDDSIESLSTLHVLEHIGLGRYGDPLDPAGPKKALLELSRVLKSGGKLYLTTPVGKSRTCFNAHRVFSAKDIIAWCPSLTLKEFSYVADDGSFHEKAPWKNTLNAQYACGMFVFTKK